MTEIVVMSLERWDGVWRRNQHLVDGLLNDPQLRVLFVEPAADPAYSVRRREWPRTGTGLRLVEPDTGQRWRGRLWAFQPTKWLPRRVDRRTDDRLARSVIRAAHRIGMTEPLLWVNDPAGAEVLRLTGWRSLYDITDDWLLADRSPEEHDRLVRQEGELMSACHEVVVCSPQLQRDKGSQRTVHLIPNAVDLSAYRSVGARPADLPNTPVVLYVGTLHRDRLDVDLCVSLVRSLSPGAALVLVGPIALGADDQQRLRGAGALLLGAREAASIPAYLRHADVLVVPHVVTPFTDSLDPIKAYEYRAAGRPVVSTRVAGFRESASESVECVDDHEAFVRAVQRLVDGGRAPTTVPGDVPTWSRRVDAMSGLLDRMRSGR